MVIRKLDNNDEWRRDGDGFYVSVTRRTVDNQSEIRGPNRWWVYAYIYHEHRLFGTFGGHDILQEAVMTLPLHNGCAYLKWHLDDDGKPTAVQVGAYYNHLHDEKFCAYETAEDAFVVFDDADLLFDYLAGNGSEER